MNELVLVQKHDQPKAADMAEFIVLHLWVLLAL